MAADYRLPREQMRRRHGTACATGSGGL